MGSFRLVTLSLQSSDLCCCQCHGTFGIAPLVCSAIACPRYGHDRDNHVCCGSGSYFWRIVNGFATTSTDDFPTTCETVVSIDHCMVCPTVGTGRARLRRPRD